MNRKQDILRYINVIKRAASYLENLIENDDGGLLEQIMYNDIPKADVQDVRKITENVAEPVIQESPVKDIPVQESSVPKKTPKQIADRKEHINRLMEIDCWPESVPSFFIKEVSAEDQINRANAVLDMMIDRSIEGKTFLDFGCGEGWISNEVLKRGVSECTGYDIESNLKWSSFSGPKFTSSFEDLKKGHYDFIMMYDVLDHVQVNPADLMKQINELLTPEGVVYVRCHPWTSKHSSHLFKKGVNKAYIHLFLTYDEIKELIGEDPMFTRVDNSPIESYYWWFNDFDIQKERRTPEPVSDFFHVTAFKELLAKEQNIEMEHIDGMLKLMEIQFIDYVLSKRKS